MQLNVLYQIYIISQSCPTYCVYKVVLYHPRYLHKTEKHDNLENVGIKRLNCVA